MIHQELIREFKIGDSVVLRANTREEGMIRRITMQAGEPLLEIFWGGGRRTTRVRPRDVTLVTDDGSEPLEALIAGRAGSPETLRRLVTVERLRRDNPLRGMLFAMHSSRTEFYAYQFKPLLKLLDSEQQRILIADEVGLGKTIEAGLIMVELAARGSLRKTIVVAPSRLRHKWRSEMLRRFGREFREMSARELAHFRRENDARWAALRLDVIVSLESLRGFADDEFLATLDPDLVVVDEAHHLRNPATQQAKAIATLAESAQALILLTATPIHLNNGDLHALLRLIDGEAFADRNATIERIEANRYVVEAERRLASRPPDLDGAVFALAHVLATPWGRIFEPTVLHMAKLLRLGPEERHAGTIRELRDQVARLNLLGHVITRTRKRDVQLHVAVREANVMRATMTSVERQVYDGVVAFVEEEIRRRHGHVTGWFLTTPRRRLASSLPAMVAHYRDRLASTIDDDDGEQRPDIDDETLRRRLLMALAPWNERCVDSKYALLLKQLNTLASEPGPAKKVVIFASYRDTLRYLCDRLERDGVKAVMMTGETPVIARAELLHTFEHDGSVRVLLTGRVGCEGLDLQFAEVLVNYDLPWNPMEVEQRIGRLDRLGQKADKIRILSLTLADTIEDDILIALYERISLFTHSIGELEPILGDLQRDIEACLIDPELTEEQRRLRAEQIIHVTEQRRLENERLEREATRFVAVDAVIDEEIARIGNRRGYVTPDLVERMVRDFLSGFPRTKLFPGEDGVQLLAIRDDLREFLGKADLAGDLSHWFSAHHDGLPVTFRSEIAYERPRVEFLNVVHPFVQAVVREDEGIEHGKASVSRLKSDLAAPGVYLFQLVEVKATCARPERHIWMVAVDVQSALDLGEEASEALLAELLERGEEIAEAELGDLATEIRGAYTRATGVLVSRIDRMRDRLEQSNAQLVDARQGSLEAYYGRRIRVQTELLERAVDNTRKERYLTLLRGRTRNLEAERTQRLAALDGLRSVGIEQRELAVGLVEVVAP